MLNLNKRSVTGVNIIKLLSGFLGATLLMCMDFFGEWQLWGTLPKWTWVVVGFALLLFSVYIPSQKERIMHFYVEVAVMIYLVALILFLPLFGGNSSVGFSADKPFLWVVILLTIWQLVSYKKRISNQQKDE